MSDVKCLLILFSEPLRFGCVLRQTAALDLSEQRISPGLTAHITTFLRYFAAQEGGCGLVRRRENGGKMSTVYYCTAATAERGGRS